MNFESILSLRSVIECFAMPTTVASGADGVVTNGDVGTGLCSGGGIWSMIIIYGALALVFIFFIYRPQKKRRQQEEALRSSIEVGDDVVTIGGICGRVVSVKEDDVIVLETGADRTKLKMKSWSISSNESAKARQAQQAPPKKKFSLFGKKKETEKDNSAK